ncbi:MAG: putative secondary metabolism biosynthetic enzyme [Bogoriella megaspora]|nr:MAG: putative secondary metabolism biosynthetic enzyme [Bogoriella megaspora]
MVQYSDDTSNSFQKQWTTNFDGIHNLQLRSEVVPKVEHDEEVLIRINTISLNYRDTAIVRGHHRQHNSDFTSTVVPCSDACATVVGVGRSAASQFKIGERVMAVYNQQHMTGQIRAEDMSSGIGHPLPGVLQEYRIFPASGLVKVPDYLSDEEACCLPIAGVTAWMSINGTRPIGQPLEKGEGGEEITVLIQGTGGVSISGLQIAKAAGAKVIVTSSSDEKLARAKGLGADFTINYRTNPDWHEDVWKLTNGHGADNIFENGGDATLRKSFDAVAFGGLINCIGYLSEKLDSADDRAGINVLVLRRVVTLKGIFNGPKDRFEEMLEFYEKHKIRPVVDRVFGFADAKDALNYVAEGQHFGKIVIKAP